MDADIDTQLGLSTVDAGKLIKASSLVLAVWDDQEAEIQTELVYAKTAGLKGIIFNPLAVDYKAL